MINIENNMSYVKIMKELDLVLPQTTQLDYTKVTKEELWDRIYNYLDKVVTLAWIEEETLEELKGLIRQYDVYGIKTRQLYPKEEDYATFDQNNYYIKQMVNSLREKVIKIICEDRGFHHNDDACYGIAIGTVDEISEFVSYKSIEKNIRNLLTYTKEKHDRIRINDFGIVDEIFLYYGLDEASYNGCYNKVIDDAKEKIRYMLANAIIDSYRLYGEYGNYHSVTQNLETANKMIAQTIKPIVDIVFKLASSKLNERKELEAVMDGEKTSQINETSSEMVASNSQQDEETLDVSLERNDTKNLSENDFDNLMLEYEKMQKLIEENKKLYSQLLELNQKRAEILNAIEENNKKMQEGIKRGSKKN